MKRCSKCGDEKPATLEFFARRPENRSGLSSQCRECRNATKRAQDRGAVLAVRRRSYEKNKAKRLARSRQWFADNPGYHRERYRRNPERGRQATKAYRDRLRAKGIKPARNIDAVRAWRERNREHCRAYFADYREQNHEAIATHRRNHKAAKRGAAGSHTSDDISRQMDAQSRRCYWCETALTAYHVDHLIPLSRGGSNGPENIVVACPFCNISRGDRLAEEWPQRPAKSA